MDQAAAPSCPLGPSPLRRLGSVRRTSTIDTSWPQGISGEMVLRGRARDLLTPADGTPPRVLAEGGFLVRASPLREILAISIDPPGPNAQQLVGARAGGKLRAVLGDIMPEERSAGTPLYLLLDDLSGASLVAYWAWSRWDDDLAGGQADRTLAGPRRRAGTARWKGCALAFVPGSSALERRCRGALVIHAVERRRAATAASRRSALGWHELADAGRAAACDALAVSTYGWTAGLRIDSSFQDSATVPGRRPPRGA